MNIAKKNFFIVYLTTFFNNFFKQSERE